MSTKQNKIADYLVEKIQALFPEKKQLFNPYTIENNNELYLLNGFGVGFGAMLEQNSVTGCININQDFIIPLSKKFYALENAAEKRQDFEKDLMDEAMTLIKNISRDVQLGGLSNRCMFTGSPGIQQVFGESQQYIYLVLTFNASFRENL